MRSMALLLVVVLSLTALPGCGGKEKGVYSDEEARKGTDPATMELPPEPVPGAAPSVTP